MIYIELDKILKERKMTAAELCKYIGLTEANLSILRSGKAKAIRFTTLDAICKVLDCEPGDILKWKEGVNYDD